MKKFFVTMMTVAFAAVLFASCESKLESDHVKRLPGKWVLTDVYPEEAARYLRVGDFITFTEDCKVKLHDSMSDMFTDLRWSYTMDLEVGGFLSVMGEDKTTSTNTIVLMYGRVASLTDQYMKLTYQGDDQKIYTYELKRQ